MLKKILIGLLITVVLLIGALIAIPFFFKDEIVAKVKEIANEELNATVDFGDFDLSIISTFPDFLFEIHDVKIIGKGAFDKDTIVYAKELNLELDLNSVIDGDQYKINSFSADGLVLNALWTKDNAFSLDLMKPSDEKDTATTEAADTSVFKLDVEEYSLTNARIVYDDPTIPYRMELINMDHSGKYELIGDEHIMKTTTDMDELSVIFDGTAYMNKVKSNIVADVVMDLAKWKFTFKENVFKFNNLTLGLDGWLTMPDEGFGMDLKFKQSNADFKDLFSMIPSDYQADLADVKTTGKFEFNGFMKGMFIGEKDIYPAFGLNLKVQDASFQYPDLPKSVKNIQIDLKVENPDGNLDHTATDLNKFHAELGGYPLDMTMKVRTPISDPFLAGNIKAQIKLDILGEVMPLDKGEEYHGNVKADISLKGNYSSIEKEEYEKFEASGNLDMTDLIYKTADMPTVNISKANLHFTPQALDLTAFESKIGNSDLSANGKIENYLGYVMKDETVKGAFSISSQYFDVNQFMSDDTTTATTAAAAEPEDTASSGAIELPKNVDFVLTSDLKKIKYDTYEIQNFAGQLLMKEGVLKFVNNTFKLLDADFKLSGQYHALNPQKPYSNLQFEIKNMDIPKAYANFNTIKKLAPICENTEGKLNMGLDVETYFTSAMDVDYNSITGKGNLFIQNAKIKESKFTQGLRDVIKSDKFNSFELKDLKIYFFITNGKVSVEPFDIKMSKSKAKVSGWNSVDMKMDYTMATSIHKDEFGGAANQQAQQLVAMLNQKTGAAVTVPEFINADIKITGDVTNPKFSIHPKGASGDAGKSVADQAKAELEKRAREEAEKLKQKAEDEARKKAEELKQQGEAELQKQKQAAEQKLKEEADKAKKEAEQKLKQQGEQKAKDALKKFGF
ncbi:MAG: AsmA-like C-terminal region-containing protein [Flavobacteriales bacterium]